MAEEVAEKDGSNIATDCSLLYVLFSKKLDVLKWWCRHGGNILSINTINSFLQKKTEILLFLLKLLPSPTSRSTGDISDAFSKVCPWMPLEILEWLHAQGAPFHQNNCPEAAAQGYFDVLKWYRARGAPWEPGKIIARAASSGNLEMVKWLRESEGIDWTKETSNFSNSSNMC
jgi:hypothetical protein